MKYLFVFNITVTNYIYYTFLKQSIDNAAIGSYQFELFSFSQLIGSKLQLIIDYVLKLLSLRLKTVRVITLNIYNQEERNWVYVNDSLFT